MNIWRLNIKPEAKGIDPRKFCISRNIMGVGWRIDSDSEKIGWKEYYEKANKYYREEKGYKGWWRAINAIKNRIKEDDLCWTRDLSGIYYLGRITDDVWRYSNDPLNRKADILNYRNCEWYKVGEVDSVPGKIVNRFIRGGAIERVTGKTIREFSKYLFNNFEKKGRYKLQQVNTDIFSLIHSDDCEDIVSLYLQDMGYCLIPSSCKKGTVNYEYVLKHEKNGNKIVAQVKKGNVDLHLDKYEDLSCDIYLFTTNGSYIGKPTSNVHIIDKDSLLNYMVKKNYVLPDKVLTWIEIYNQLETDSSS